MSDIPPDFATLQPSIQSALLSVTRTSGTLAATDIPFQRSLDPSFGRALTSQNARLRSLGERLIRVAQGDAAPAEPSGQGSGKKGAGILGSGEEEDAEAVDVIDRNWRGVVDVLDGLLEKADSTLDEFSGVVKRMDPESQSPAPPKGKTQTRNTYRLQDITKPQELFEAAPTNDETAPWKPLLHTKPHAVVPLDQSLVTVANDDGLEQYQHPYQTEIEQYDYPEWVYQNTDPQPYHPFESTTATFVDTPEAVDEMLQELKQAKEIAIDLEHHDARTYIGLVSLMQISTRDKDWVVDTLKPWRRKLQVLNEVFTDPKILKVLHGAYMDVVWLQRDLGLYLVGLFDTHHASRVLGYAGGSLAFLLQKFVNFNAQKQYQMADWRIRPLPTEMFDYARSDTHFLLYIFDHIRNELVARDSDPPFASEHMHGVLEKSKATALNRYEYPSADPATGLGTVGWFKLIARTPALLDRQQFSVFRRVHAWRDRVAREEDESTNWVLANHGLFSIARAMPTTKQQLWKMIGTVSPVMRQRGDELVEVVRVAKEQGKNGPEMVEVLKKMEGLLPKKFERDMASKFARGPSTAETLREIRNGVANGTTPSDATTTATTVPDPALQKFNPATWAADSLRGLMSRFWGGSLGQIPTPMGVKGHQKRDQLSHNVSLSLPLPPLTAEVFSDFDQLEGPSQPAEPPAHSFVPASSRPEAKADDIFVIKQLGMHKAGKKRKSEAISSDPALPESGGPAPAPDAFVDGIEEVHVTDTDDSDAGRRFRGEMRAAEKGRKRERKRQKKAEKQRRSDVEPAGDGEAVETAPEPFDYASAPSVLHPAGQPEQSGKKAMNPFRKGLDAPRGKGRRMNPDGISGTWKG
ncbi:hypothetical protein P152DRAFT_462632 [Eremomyces bilateralis CBS 781.70]|uniref:HRDC domain-containing protein n=1 Tax=Eremomyces bilateralis CBS 781.70 TaxID=1392243 RepID=A0A6G1FRK4_9PEZI|nr:uncharacterized protein P152DRAFT_462632 [Eremomyces bilateralis CBS 781.70]KAF1808356.1 hypothetical protein P152DRAFT_462632 [Eremomyces bilateralis CBS 781.70]